jgi:leucyl/phenylalanyl-tRNA--protein transferase
MFSRETDASKVCLVHLVSHLRARGFTLLDSQLPNPHLARFGQVLIPHEAFMAQLHRALAHDVTF